MCGASLEGHPSRPGQRYHPAKPWSARRESSARISVCESPRVLMSVAALYCSPLARPSGAWVPAEAA